MSSGYERFLRSPELVAIKANSMKRAEKEWASLPSGFRCFLCKQAGLRKERGEGRLADFDFEERQALYNANKALGVLVDAARGPLVTAGINEPRPRNDRFKL